MVQPNEMIDECDTHSGRSSSVTGAHRSALFPSFVVHHSNRVANNLSNVLASVHGRYEVVVNEFAMVVLHVAPRDVVKAQ